MIQDFTRFFVRGVCSLLTLLLSACNVGLSSIAGFFPTPVCQEIVADNLTKAMQLINEGADPNAGNGCALVAAASRGQLQMVKLLLDRGANPNRTVSGDLTVVMGGATPLVAAVQSRDVRVVRLLLERGANPRDDFDAFQVVINFSDIAMAELLLRHGANANMKHSANAPVYYYVEIRPREFQQKEVPPRDLAPDRIDDTIKRLHCKVSTSRGKSLLHVAVGSGGVGGQEGRERIAELLIERGADPNVSTLNGETPLMTASRWTGNPRTVSMLKAAGADVNAMDRCGRTAEDYAKMFPGS